MPKHNYHVLAKLFLQKQEGFLTFALSTEMKTLSPDKHRLSYGGGTPRIDPAACGNKKE